MLAEVANYKYGIWLHLFAHYIRNITKQSIIAVSPSNKHNKKIVSVIATTFFNNMPEKCNVI
jgi:hypothetical protein